MTPHAIPAYGDNLSDPDFLSPSRGVLPNFLESCSRHISRYFANTGIPGTPYTGIDVDLSTCANPYGGLVMNDRGRNPITVGLSIASSHFEMGVRDVFRIQLVLEARVYLPTPPISNSLDEARETERAYRDTRNHAAVVEGLYLALHEIPFFSGGLSTGQIIPAESLEHSFPTTPVVTGVYEVPVRIYRNEQGIERIGIAVLVDGSPGPSWKEPWKEPRDV